MSGEQNQGKSVFEALLAACIKAVGYGIYDEQIDVAIAQAEGITAREVHKKYYPECNNTPEGGA